jgi:hypothetical protein
MVNPTLEDTMNKIAITSVLAVMTGLAGAPQTAKAGDDEVFAAIGGFIGGAIVASAIHDNHNHRAHAYCEFDGCRDRYVIRHAHRGPHRDWVTVRVWVPGRWVVRHDGYGRRERFYVKGHYDVRREYVAVDRHGRRGYDRDYDRGYGRRDGRRG